MPNIPHEYDPPWADERPRWCYNCEQYVIDCGDDLSDQGAPEDWCGECQAGWVAYREGELV